MSWAIVREALLSRKSIREWAERSGEPIELVSLHLSVSSRFPLRPFRRPSTMSRTRSATFTSSIMTWAAAVQPGSPAPQTPATPHTGKSVYTPSSAHQFDLTALGYTSVFVHLPTTPATPPYLLNNNDNNTYPISDLNLSENNNLSHLDRDNKPSCASPKDNKPSLDITDSSSGDASRHRIPLVGVLSRSRTRSKSMSAHSVPAKSSKTSSKKHQQLPPSLMNELLLLQFTSGGKLDAHMTRAVEKGAVSDGKGGVWWDQDEYKPLVPRQPSPSKEKRRPAPLNLARQQPSFVPAVNALPSAPLPQQKKSGMKSVRAFFSRDKAV